MIQPFAIPRRMLPDSLLTDLRADIVEAENPSQPGRRCWDLAWLLSPFVERRIGARVVPSHVCAGTGRNAPQPRGMPPQAEVVILLGTGRPWSVGIEDGALEVLGRDALLVIGAGERPRLGRSKRIRLSIYYSTDVEFEALEEWGGRAAAQMARLGPHGYRYECRQILDADDIEGLLAARERHVFSWGQMHRVGYVGSRRRTMVAEVLPAWRDDLIGKIFAAADEVNRQVWQHPDIRPAAHLLWNHYPQGGFITWHEDTGPGDPRTFSVITLLQPAAEGGELQLNGEDVIPLRPGEGVIFPAQIYHRVSPVVRGTRDTLTLWVHSPQNLWVPAEC